LRTTLRNATVLALAGWATQAWGGASTSAIVTATSDYDFRGFTLSENKPAMQAGLDLNTENLHGEVWTSSEKSDGKPGFYGADHAEIAVTADVLWGDNASIGYDAGAVYFKTPGSTPSDAFIEYFASVTHDWISAALHGAPRFGELRAGYYFETNVTWPLRDPFKLIVHAGATWGPYWERVIQRTYQDYAFGLAASLGKFDWQLRFVGTRDFPLTQRGAPYSGAPRFVFSVTTTLPW
jgi:uncharacterized protein (TIGR02001 family)